MRKRLFEEIITALLLLYVILPFGFTQKLKAQAETSWHVDTVTQKKNVLMEEFTGTACYWCTEGHAMTERMAHIWPGRVFPVNIHTGSLAQAYKTKEGDQIGSYLDCESAGYPSGDVNRRDFGFGYVMSRSNWLLAADYVMQEDAPVNLFMQSEYDAATRQLSVHVEGYFTAEVSEEQRLTVMLLQNNVWGYQNGPEQGDYRHMHMLRQTLGDVWGDLIEEAAQGQYFSREYTLDLPTRIGDVVVKPYDLQLLAFVSAGRTDVEQVTGARPQCDDFDTSLSVQMEAPRIGIGTQYGYDFFEVLLENESNRPVTSATFDLTVGQQSSTVTIDCNIPPYGFQYLSIPMTYTYNKRGTTRYSITLSALNGADTEPQSLDGQFVKPFEVTQQVMVKLQTDTRASQNTFTIRNQQGEMIHDFGHFESGEAQSVEELVTLEAGKTYCLEVTDEWGDGSMAGATGYIELRDAQGVLIDKTNIYGYGERIFFTTSETNGISMVTTTDAPPRYYKVDGNLASPAQHGIVIEQSNGKTRKFINQ